METKVMMIESERGWGSRVDQIITFPTRAEAVKYANEYNQKYNNQKEVPDWYIIAEVESE